MSRTRIVITGGERAARALERIARNAGNGSALSVGFYDNATYPNEADTQVAQVAFWNEFGTARTPARPFFRDMIDKKSEKWGAVLAANLQASNYNVPRSLALLGELIKDQLTASIRDWDQGPPNAPATIARKGFDKPLTDSSTLQRSTGYEVFDKGV